MENTQTAEQPLTFAQRMGKSQSEKDEQAMRYAIEDAKLSLEQDIRQTDRQLTASRRERENLLNSPTPNWSSIVQKDVEIEGYKKGLETLRRYMAELFPENK